MPKDKKPKKKGNSKLAVQGSKIMALSAKIREKHPTKAWKDCVKEAGKEMKNTLAKE